MPASDRAAKKGIRDRLRTTTGLRPEDGWVVRSAAVPPEEIKADMVILGDVTATQTQAGLATRAKTSTCTGWVMVTRPGAGEDAIDQAGDRADEGMSLVEGALAAAPSVGGAVLPPGQVKVATSGLEETPVDWNGSAARRAIVPFSLSWTSHVT
jgi:hypothetical protein